ncbi:MAG: hypothetical protein LBC61_05945 [Candidatus Peribacteria bacterium]|nr:hypothetical protein [Candidatus Peribacteria bacterium]
MLYCIWRFLNSFTQSCCSKLSSACVILCCLSISSAVGFSLLFSILFGVA